jgi:uncharacterized membrane protein YdbT with pleckstrin-like domain
MRYIHKTLIENEQIIYMTRPHWIIFAVPIAALLLAFCIFLFGNQLIVLNIKIYKLTLFEILAIFAALYGLYHFLKIYIFYRSAEYGITNKRVLMKTGWIEREALEIFLDKIEGVHIDQTVPGRILGYGSVMIIGTGGSKDPFNMVPRPLHFRKLVQQEMDYAEERFRPAH